MCVCVCVCVCVVGIEWHREGLLAWKKKNRTKTKECAALNLFDPETSVSIIRVDPRVPASAQHIFQCGLVHLKISTFGIV